LLYFCCISCLNGGDYEHVTQREELAKINEERVIRLEKKVLEKEEYFKSNSDSIERTDISNKI